MAKKIISAEATLAKCAAEIRRLGKAGVKTFIEIGRQLTIARDAADHGEWKKWLDRELGGWSESTALKYIQSYKLSVEYETDNKSKSVKITDLNIGLASLFRLAAPSTPKEARDEVANRGKGGKKVSTKEVKKVIEEEKKKKAAPAKEPAKKSTKKPEGKPEEPPTTTDEQPAERPAGNDTDAGESAAKRKEEFAKEELQELQNVLDVIGAIFDDLEIAAELMVQMNSEAAMKLAHAIYAQVAKVQTQKQTVEDSPSASSPPTAPAPTADALELPEGLRRTTAPSVQAEATEQVATLAPDPGPHRDDDAVVVDDAGVTATVADLPMELGWTHPEKEQWRAEAGPDCYYDAVNLNNDRWFVSYSDEEWNERKLGSWKKLTDAKRHAQEDWNNQRQLLIQNRMESCRTVAPLNQGLRAIPIETANVDVSSASLVPQGQENSEDAS
jgi:Protein of unknown function (DUF3102)